MSYAVPASGTTTCELCGRDVGPGFACQFCEHLTGYPPSIKLSSPARRFGGHVLDYVLMIVTLFVGWIIWGAIVFRRGQSPAKQILGMRVIKVDTGRRLGVWMMFLREVILKPLISFPSAFLLYIPLFWTVWDKNNQELWDKMIGTLVVNDPTKELAEGEGRPLTQARAQLAPVDPMSGDLDRLQKLAALHSSGALSDEEFATEKRRILGSPE